MALWVEWLQENLETNEFKVKAPPFSSVLYVKPILNRWVFLLVICWCIVICGQHISTDNSKRSLGFSPPSQSKDQFLALALVSRFISNTTWRFQTSDNENRYLTRNWINSSSTKPQKAITLMHLNVILPLALQTTKFYYICNSFILAPIPTSP